MRSVSCVTAVTVALIVTFAGFVGRADAKVLHLWCVELKPCNADCYDHSLTLDTENRTVSQMSDKGHRLTFTIAESSADYSWSYLNPHGSRNLITLDRGTLEEIVTSESKRNVLARYRCSLSHNAI
jgi:hypothetical protein